MLFLLGATRNRTGDKGFADLCLTAWLWRRIFFISLTVKVYHNQLKKAIGEGKKILIFAYAFCAIRVFFPVFAFSLPKIPAI